MVRLQHTEKAGKGNQVVGYRFTDRLTREADCQVKNSKENHITANDDLEIFLTFFPPGGQFYLPGSWSFHIDSVNDRGQSRKHLHKMFSPPHQTPTAAALRNLIHENVCCDHCWNRKNIIRNKVFQKSKHIGKLLVQRINFIDKRLHCISRIHSFQDKPHKPVEQQHIERSEHRPKYQHELEPLEFNAFIFPGIFSRIKYPGPNAARTI